MTDTPNLLKALESMCNAWENYDWAGETQCKNLGNRHIGLGPMNRATKQARAAIAKATKGE